MKIKQLKLLEKRLPKHPGIMGREKLFNAAVLIPLICKREEYYFLFEKKGTPHKTGR